MSRPQNLREVAAATIAGTKPFANAIDGFVDATRLDRPDKTRRQRRLDELSSTIFRRSRRFS